MPLLKRKRVLAAKVEATPGTAESLSATEAAFNAYDVMIQAAIEVERREAQGQFGSLAGVAGARQGKATFKTDLGWDGTSTEPAWATVFLPACGYVLATNTFTPRTEAPGANVKTLTIACYINGLRKILAGCMGTFKLVAPTGRMPYIEWEFTGKWTAPTDVTILAPTYPTDSPLRFASGVVEWNNVAQRVELVTFDAGHEITLLEDPTDPSGFGYAVVVERAPKFSASPESVLVATQNRWSQWISSTEATFELDIAGPTTSVLSIDAPKAAITNTQEGDRGKIVTDDVEWACNKNTTLDTEVSIIFTPAA